VQRNPFLPCNGRTPAEGERQHWKREMTQSVKKLIDWGASEAHHWIRNSTDWE